MPSLGQFANTAPTTGELRIFYKVLPNGTDEIKAITVSTTDLNGRVIIPSLREINSVRASITGSGDRTTMIVEDIAQRPNNFYYLNIEDSVIEEVSGSANTIVNLDPFLVSNFFNSEHSSLISNATDARKSDKFFDVDRAGGTDPSNFNAIRGIQSLNYPFLLKDSTGAVKEKLEIDGSTFSGVGGQLLFYSEPRRINGSIDTELEVSLKELEDTIGFPAGLNVSVLNSSVGIVNNLHLQIASDPGFTTSITTINLAQWAQQDNTSYGNITFYPYIHPVASGSLGSFYYARLRHRVANGTSEILTSDNVITVTPLFKTVKNTKESLNVLVHKDERVPYAPNSFTQDSNYTSTGIVNARYSGTKTTEADYGGITSAIAGKTFEAMLFPSSSTFAAMYTASQNVDEEQLQTLLHSGNEDLPVFKVTNKYMFVHKDYAIPSASDHSMVNEDGTPAQYESIVVDTFGRPVTPGDVISITSASVQEHMFIHSAATALNIFGQPVQGAKQTVLRLEVTRDYLETGYGISVDPPATVDKREIKLQSGGDNIYRIEGSSVVSIANKKVIPDPLNFLETGEILYINNQGRVSDKSNSLTGSFVTGV